MHLFSPQWLRKNQLCCGCSRNIVDERVNCVVKDITGFQREGLRRSERLSPQNANTNLGRTVRSKHFGALEFHPRRTTNQHLFIKNTEPQGEI